MRRTRPTAAPIAAGTAAFLSLLPSPAAAGLNPNAAFPLHARIVPSPPCDMQGMDCQNERPTTNVPAQADIVVYLFLFDHCAVSGVQTAFEWPSDWTLKGSEWDCQANQITAVIPLEPGGSTAGTIATAFDCVTHDLRLPVIGRLFFKTGSSGCLRQVVSSYAYGNHLVDCHQGQDEFNSPYDALRFGWICVNTQGNNACVAGLPPSCMFTPVETRTWGRIKSTYR